MKLPRLPGHRAFPRLCHLASALANALAATAAFGLLGAASAQGLAPPEQAQAEVLRKQPAQAPFDPSIVQRLRVPPGFAVNIFASGLGRPRMLDVGPDGTVYVTRRDRGDVLALNDSDGDGRADRQRSFARGLPGVHGIAVQGNTLWLASSTHVWRTPAGEQAVPETMNERMPDGGQHPNRMVRIAPDGAVVVSIGSSCNDCAEENQLLRAVMARIVPNQRTPQPFANGLRNTIGYDWHPVTRELWGMDHGTDYRGDDTPPEELNLIRDGGNYGWPICYGERTVDPMTNAPPSRVALRPGQTQATGEGLTREQFCATTEPARLQLTAHSAPIAMRFYTGTQFPAAWRNDAFIALRGSWNRAQPAGYKVVRLRFTPSGQPIGFEDFLTGFLADDGSTQYGRPAGVAIAADGTLLFSDDNNGVIYRVRWVGGAGRGKDQAN